MTVSPTTRAASVIALGAVLSTAALASLPASAEPLTAAPPTTTPAVDKGSSDVVNVAAGPGRHDAVAAAVARRPLRGENSGIAVVRTAGGRSSVADLSLMNAPDPQDRAMWTADATGVELSWGRLPGVQQYRISKDGVELATVRGASFTDATARPGDEVEYVVQSISPERAPGATASASGRTWGLAVVVPDAPSDDLQAVTAAADVQIAAAAAISQTAVVHETFIPQAYLASPPVGCGSYSGSTYSFGGDNRTYVANSSKYRTRLAAVINWLSSGAVTSYKHVGATKVYRTSTKALLATRTASTANMGISRLAASTSTRADLRFNLQSSNPFCTGIPNSIDAAFTLIVSRSGSWSITSGSHKQMPNHELYLARGGLAATAWTTAYRRTYANAACLINGACPRASMTGYGGAY